MVDFEFKAQYNLEDFRAIIALLRSPGGCPWDIEQTHESIRRNLLEEAYEVCEAIDEGSPDHLKEELGDLMMQVLFHSRIEEEKGVFDVDAVADAACKKLIFRHPHVFGDVQVEGSGQVLVNWEELKRREKSQTTVTKSLEAVAKSLPALWRAEKLLKKASKAGADFPNAADKLRGALAGFESALGAGDSDKAEGALGELLFSAVSLARAAGVDPEMALQKSCDEFIGEFAKREERGETN
ncbi:MAG: nucleoside triphosphate pyrophosphohydrolase [Oscillospiraceae bacterium]|jgi:tetrapyrrole methylase family protein/MazG family protein|nr:nucleoside triphosphate pyrophosphohydrolase [Oscillospiraceae bacterium]